MLDSVLSDRSSYGDMQKIKAWCSSSLARRLERLEILTPRQHDIHLVEGPASSPSKHSDSTKQEDIVTDAAPDIFSPKASSDTTSHVIPDFDFEILTNPRDDVHSSGPWSRIPEFPMDARIALLSMQRPMLSLSSRLPSMQPHHDTNISRALTKLQDHDGTTSIDSQGTYRYYGKTSALSWLTSSNKYDGGYWHLPERISASDAAPAHRPPLPVQDHLFDIYFAHVHPTFPFVERSEILRGQANPLLQLCVLLVAMMYAVEDDFGGQAASERIYEQIGSLLQKDIAAPRICTVQSALLLALWDIGCGRTSRSWVYIGIAIRMAQDLGLHRSSKHLALTTESRQTRLLTWWSCYLLEHMVSCWLGRLPAINIGDIDAELPSVDGSEEWDFWKPVEGVRREQGLNQRSRSYALSTFVCFVELFKVVDVILAQIYGLNPRCNNDQQLDALQHQLAGWKSTVPQWLQDPSNAGYPHAFLPHIYYETAIVLLNRPFDSDVQINASRNAASSVFRLVQIFGSRFSLATSMPLIVYPLITAGSILVKMDSTQEWQGCLSALRDVSVTWPVALDGLDLLTSCQGNETLETAKVSMPMQGFSHQRHGSTSSQHESIAALQNLLFSSILEPLPQLMPDAEMDAERIAQLLKMVDIDALLRNGGGS